MSFIKKLFYKPQTKLHILPIEQKISFAFDVLDQFTPLVSAGIQDLKKLKHNKELIKNSILYIYRELKIEPGKSFILKKHLNLNSEQKYIEYFDLLSLMLMSLSDFSDRKNVDISKHIKEIDKTKPSEINKDLEAMVSMNKEKINEYTYYLSEVDSIDNDIKNETNFKKIKYFDME